MSATNTKTRLQLLHCCRYLVYLEWVYVMFMVSDCKVVVPCVIEKQKKTRNLQVSVRYRYKLWEVRKEYSSI